MALSTISQIRIAGIAAAVPAQASTFEDLCACAGSEADARKIIASTGIARRRLAPAGVCASDLCATAACRLFDDLEWTSDSVDLLVVVTQTPDYVQPATACVLHGRLGLPKHAPALDINLGCSGYVYGLWTVMSLLAASDGKRALLLTGDTMSRLVSPVDRTTAPLFGDAGSATALVRDKDVPAAYFALGSDGKGWKDLLVPVGGFRQPKTAETSRRVADPNGNVRSDEDFRMNGLEVFSFTLREVPPMIHDVLRSAGRSIEHIDLFVFHQANEFILKNLARKMRIPEAKLVVALREFGNTSSASIPLALVSRLAHATVPPTDQVLLAGFGVGLSWAAVQLPLQQTRISTLVEMEVSA